MVALFSSSCCLVIVMWLFLMVPCVCLQFVIVVFPDHTQLLFLHTYIIRKLNEGVGIMCLHLFVLTLYLQIDGL